MNNTPYWQQTDDWRAGFIEGGRRTRARLSAWELSQLRAKPMNLKTPVRELTKLVPEGALHVESIHRNLGKNRDSIKIRRNTVLQFLNKGRDTGIVTFALYHTDYSAPIIMGVYSYDHKDPLRSQPLLKGFEVNAARLLSYYDVSARRLATDFGHQNRVPIWFWLDRHGGYKRRLIPGGLSLKWWQDAELRSTDGPYKGHRSKHLRSLDKLDGDNKAVFYYDGTKWV